MPFLTDRELVGLLSCKPRPIQDLELPGLRELYATESPIQPCSVDLTIGRIFRTPKNSRIYEKADWTEHIGLVERHELKVGSTLRVETKESFNFVRDFSQFGALLSPPARVSRMGLLLLDLGHVDPGFAGPVRTTIVNLGRESIEIYRGMKILTALLFRIEEPVHRGYLDRRGPRPYETGGIQDVVYLSSDFMNVGRRIRKGTERAIRRRQMRHEVYLAAFSAAAAFAIAYGTNWFFFERRLSSTEGSVGRLQGSLSVERANRRLEALEVQIHDMQDRLERLGAGSSIPINPMDDQSQPPASSP